MEAAETLIWKNEGLISKGSGASRRAFVTPQLMVFLVFRAFRLLFQGLFWLLIAPALLSALEL